MIEKINANQIRDIWENPLSKQADSTKASNNEVDASLQVSYDSLIEKAKQIPETDAETVQKAIELLSSGQLESPENIRAAAKNIVTFGI